MTCVCMQFGERVRELNLLVKIQMRQYLLLREVLHHEVRIL
jgi:hypothetical protein